MYRAVKQRRVEHFASRSISGCLQALFCKSFDMAICLEQIFGRATELHDAMARLTVIYQRNHSNVTANNAHENLSAPTSCRSLTVSCIAQLDERFTRQKVAACMPAKCVFTRFFK